MSDDDALPERYTLMREVGSGGMGVVYEAREGERRLAIKTLRYVDEETIYRLKAEFRSLQDISHPNLIQLGELVENRGRWFLTMEYVDGVDFLSYVQADPRHDRYRFDEARLRDALRQLASGLSALHAAGKVHRDIKPANVLITAAGRVVLLDLGLVADTGERKGSGTIVGTAAYMAPEQAATAQRHPAGDWYAVGVMLYEAMTGRVPFEGEPLRVLMDKQASEPAPPHALVANLPADLDALCVRLLRTDPAERPSGGELLRLLGVSGDGGLAFGTRPSGSGSALFVGRGAELRQLADAFERSRTETSVIAITGESGVGKSALVAEFLRQRRAASPELVTLTGRCYEREQIPYKALDGVLDQLSSYLGELPRAEADRLVPDDAALLCRLFPVLRRARSIAEARLPARELHDPYAVRQRSLTALRTLLTRMAARSDVVLAIDDIQWADQDSFELLVGLLTPPMTPRLLVLLGSREPLTNLSPQLRALAIDHLDLGRLDPEAAQQLARRLLAQASSLSTGARAQGIADEAAGHPLFIAELVRHDVITAATPTAPRPRSSPPPLHAHSSLDEVIRQRVDSLPASAQRIMALLALADTPLAEEALRFASDLEPDTLARELARLRVASLARSSSRRAGFLEPYHDRVRQAVHDGLEPAAIPALHRSIAMALEATGGENTDPHALVRHYQRAGDHARAAAQAERAGRAAAEALAFDRAIQMYRTALELGADRDPADQRAQRLALAEALVHAGRGAEAADEFLRAADGADRATRLQCTTQACMNLLMSGHVERGYAVLEQVLADAGIRAPVDRAGTLRAILWHRTMLRLRGLRWTPRDLTRITPEELLQLDILRSLALLGMVDSTRGNMFSARHLRLALRVGEPTRLARAIAHEASYACVYDAPGHSKARALLAIARDIMKDRDAPSIRVSIDMLDAYVTFFEGRFRDAIDKGQAVLRVMPEHPGHYWEQSTLQLVLVFAYLRIGDINGLRDARDRALRDATQRRDRYLETTLRRYCQLIDLADDDPAAARAQLELATWVPARGEIHVQHYFEHTARIEIAAYEGDLAAARQGLVDLEPGYRASFLSRAQSLRTGLAWIRGRLALLGGDRDAAAAAATTLERDDAVHSPVWAGLLRAGLAASSGDLAAARGHLVRTVDLAVARDMELCATLARHHLGTLGDPDAARLAADWMRHQRVRAPARLVRLYAPGFDAST